MPAALSQLHPEPTGPPCIATTGRSCPEQSVARLRNFASKMDIRGLGPRTLDLLLAARPGLEPPDLYSLTQVRPHCWPGSALAAPVLQHPWTR